MTRLEARIESLERAAEPELPPLIVGLGKSEAEARLDAQAKLKAYGLTVEEYESRGGALMVYIIPIPEVNSNE